MKKIFTTIVALAFLSAMVSAQSVQLYYEGNAVNDGDTLYIPYTSFDIGEFLVEPLLGFSNVSGNALTLTTRIAEENLAPGHSIQMCVNGQCYATGTATFELAAGETVSAEDERSFHANFMPENEGTSVVKFTFENANNTSDAVSFYAMYYYATGVSDVSAVQEMNAYPNPATSMVTVEYSSALGNKGCIVIKNLLGGVVSRHSLDGSGKCQISLSGVPAGVYFYGLEDASGKMICTKKLLVK